MPNLYKITVSMYVEAIDEERALSLAELNCFSGTEGIRKANYGWVEDKISLLRSEQIVELVETSPSSSYDKELLIKILGEDKAISFLLAATNTTHP